MRLEKIAADYLHTQTEIAQIPLDDVDRSDQFHFSSVRIKDRIVNEMAPIARRILKVIHRARIAFNFDARITSAHIGYRFSRVKPPTRRGDGSRIADVLVVDCSDGDAATQRWLASAVKSVSGIEPALMHSTWAKTLALKTRPCAIAFFFPTKHRNVQHTQIVAIDARHNPLHNFALGQQIAR